MLILILSKLFKNWTGSEIHFSKIYNLMRFLDDLKSQVRICRPTPLSFAPILMKDTHSADSNEKSIFRFFFLSYG